MVRLKKEVLADLFRNNTEVDEYAGITFALTVLKVISMLGEEQKHLKEKHELGEFKFDFTQINSAATLKKVIDQIEPLREELNNLLLPILNPEYDSKIAEAVEELRVIDYEKMVLRCQFREIALKLLEITYDSISTISLATLSEEPFVADLLQGLLKIKDFESIIDPFIGRGRTLLMTKTDRVNGGDVNSWNTSIAKIAFTMANIESKVTTGDSLSHLQDKEDIFLSLPPFGMRGDIEVYSKYQSDKVNRFSDLIFLNMGMELAKKRGAVVLSEKPLLSMSDKLLRKEIVEGGHITGIINLPGNAILGTGISSNIVLFDMENKHDSIIFIEAKDFFKRERGRLDITPEKMKELVDVYGSRKEVPGISKSVSLKEVVSGEGLLTVRRYVEEITEKFDLVAGKKQLSELERDMLKYREITNKLIEEYRN